MSFVGAIPHAVRKFFGNNAHIFNGRKIIDGCCGNFTTEQIISTYSKDYYLQANDIALYSSVLGNCLLGRDMMLEPIDEELFFLKDHMKSIDDKATIILMFSSLIKHYQQDTEFRKRMWKHYKDNFIEYFNQNKSLLLGWKEKIRIHEYTTIDVFDLFKDPPLKDAILLGFLPTYQGGYEKLYNRLHKAFRWESPKYEMLTNERREEAIHNMAQQEYVLFTDSPRQDMGDPVMIAQKIQFHSIFIYSNLEFRRAITRWRIGSNKKYFDLLKDEDEIDQSAQISIAPIDSVTMNYYRDLYLGKTVGIPSIAETALAILVDSKIIGFVGFNRIFDRAKDWRRINLLCDFVVPSTKYNRLAKLLLLVIKSDEMKRYLEEKHLQEFNYCLTSVFTDKPVSMKYRPLFELIERKQSPPRLKYKGQLGTIKLCEVISTWIKKYQK